MTPASLDVDISGFGLRFEGIPPELSDQFSREWPAFLRAVPEPSLVIRVEDAERAMTPSRFMDGTLRIERGTQGPKFRYDEGEIEPGAQGARAVARLALGDPRRRFWGLVNLACAAVSWQLTSCGGGALHAAGVLLEGRVYVMIGASGCGKTTWARTASEAGLLVLSDDCVLVDGAGGTLVAIGSPFRSKDFPSPGRGRWPVAALLVPQHAAAASLAPISQLKLEAVLAANVLFASIAGGRDTATQAATAIAAAVPSRTLSFRPDASWIDIVSDL